MNAVGVSIAPSAASTKKTAGNPMPTATAAASREMFLICSPPGRRRVRASVPTKSLYSSASATATAVAASVAATTPGEGGCCSSATTRASPTIAP